MKVFLIILAITSVKCEDIDWNKLGNDIINDYTHMNVSTVVAHLQDDTHRFHTILNNAIQRYSKENLEFVGTIYVSADQFLHQLVNETLAEISLENNTALRIGDTMELGISIHMLRVAADLEDNKRIGRQLNVTDTEEHLYHQFVVFANQTVAVLRGVIKKESQMPNKSAWAKVHTKVCEYLSNGLELIEADLLNIKDVETRRRNLQQIMNDVKVLDVINQFPRGPSQPAKKVNLLTLAKNKLTDLWSKIKSFF